MANALISVIIPVYNAEKYIKRSVQSVLTQTYKEIEVLIVDDGSTDGSASVCSSIDDIRIKVIRQENAGPAQARNTGLEYASGEFVCFLDADDYFEPTFIETLYIGIQHADISVCGYNVVSEHFEITSAYRPEEGVVTSTVAVNYVLYQKAISGFLWNKMFRKSLIINNNLHFIPSVFVGEDLLFVLNYLSFAADAVFFKETLYNYTYIETSISHNVDDRKLTLLDAYSEAYTIFDDERYRDNILSLYMAHYLTFYELLYNKDEIQCKLQRFMNTYNISDQQIIKVLNKTDKMKYKVYRRNKPLFVALMKSFRLLKKLRFIIASTLLQKRQQEV